MLSGKYTENSHSCMLIRQFQILDKLPILSNKRYMLKIPEKYHYSFNHVTKTQFNSSLHTSNVKKNAEKGH